MTLRVKLIFLTTFLSVLLVFFSGALLLYWKKQANETALTFDFSGMFGLVSHSAGTAPQPRRQGTSGIRALLTLQNPTADEPSTRVESQGTFEHPVMPDQTMVTAQPRIPNEKLNNPLMGENTPITRAKPVAPAYPARVIYERRPAVLSSTDLSKTPFANTSQSDSNRVVPVVSEATVSNTPSPKLSKAVTPLPQLVVYDDEAVIEFPETLASRKNMTLAIARVLLSPNPQQEPYLLAKKPLHSTQRPYFYKRVRDQNNQPIRYPKQAFRYADYLISHATETYQDEEGRFVSVRVPLKPYGLRGPAKNYQAWVENYAKEFSINPTLVYAVMETESAFNPKAVSRSNAVGLMQVKAHTAGKDVYEYVDLKTGQPSLSELFNSEQNIRMGTAYLGLLKHDYFNRIADEKIKELLTISSYNGGLSTVLGLFGQNREEAIARLNRLSPEAVYRTLTREHPSDETRRYLDKVLQAEVKYKNMLDEV